MHATPSAIPEDLPGNGNVRRRPLTGFGVVAVLTVFGLALVFQASRWSKTPAYGNLLHIMSAHMWGFIYLAIAVLMGSGLILWNSNRTVNVIAHTLAFILFAVWEMAFIVRYFTDSATTVVNVVSWAAYLFLVYGSAMTIDRRPRL